MRLGWIRGIDRLVLCHVPRCQVLRRLQEHINNLVGGQRGVPRMLFLWSLVKVSHIGLAMLRSLAEYRS